MYARFIRRIVEQMNSILALLDGEDEGDGKALFSEVKPSMQRIAYRVRRINANRKEIMGIGIAAKHILLLFESFYRVDNSNERAPGWGFPSSSDSRAQVDVESQMGKGTCFSVRFVRKL